jgi:hypothetical protein
LEHFGVGQAPRSAGHEESLCSEELLNTAADRLEAAATSDVKRCEETFFFPNGQTIAAKYGQIARMQSNFAIHCCKVCILWQFKDV